MFSVVEYAAWTVVLLYAFDQGGAGLAGFVAVAQLLPAALVAPALAPLAERPSRSAALAGAYLGIGALLAAMALSMGRQFTATIALAVLSTIVMSVARPLHYSALPQVAPDPPDPGLGDRRVGARRRGRGVPRTGPGRRSRSAGRTRGGAHRVQRVDGRGGSPRGEPATAHDAGVR